MILTHVAAMASNRVIGADRGLPWDIPEDMKFFRDTTKGHAMIMGRKTFETFPSPLKNRFHIIVTRNKDFKVEHPDVHVVHSIEDAVEYAKGLTDKWGEEVFIVGGGEIYRLSLPYTDRIYLTEIDREFEGDTTFPELDPREWSVVEKRPSTGDVPFVINTYERSHT